MAKFFNKIIWNKQPDHEYDISTTADKVFIQESKHFTVLDFFSWVKSFFEKGAFFFYGTDEPQSYQTRVWLDTTPFFMTIAASSTTVDDEALTQTIITGDGFEIPFAVERAFDLKVQSVTAINDPYVKYEVTDDTVIIYGSSSSAANINYLLDGEYTITYVEEQEEEMLVWTLILNENETSTYNSLEEMLDAANFILSEHNQSVILTEENYEMVLPYE